MEVSFTGLNGVSRRHVMTEFNFEGPVMRALHYGIFREFYVVDKNIDSFRYFCQVEIGPLPYQNLAPFPFYVLHWLTSEIWMKKIDTLSCCIPESISHIFENLNVDLEFE